MKKILAGLFVMASMGLVTGCVFVPARGYVEYDGPVVEYGYEPILYDGYVVYYADGGIPFIWMNGMQFWIPLSERPYYEAHYRQHSSAYHEWYRNRGDHYREHRYTNRNNDGRHPNNADDRERDPRPVVRPVDNREHNTQPVLRPAENREHNFQPVQHPSQDREHNPSMRPAPEVRPQPKVKPEHEDEQKPKAKLHKKDGE
jgi:hypothetical protein